MELLKEKIIVNKGLFNNIDIIENTLDSFNEAFKNNYVVRCKLQCLKDGELVILESDALERLFNLKDSLKHINFDDLEYISKFEILKLGNLLNVLNDNFIILNVSNLKKKIIKKLMKLLDEYRSQIIIESNNIKILKLLKKHNFNVSLLVNKKNKNLVNGSLKCDIYNIEIGLFDKKVIKKLTEENFILGSIVKDKNTLKELKNVYSNLVLEI